MRGITLLTVAVAAMLTMSFVASAHGFTTTFPSRQYLCKQGVVANCGDIKYEPQSVEGPGGFPAAGPPDGAICSAGISRFAALDTPLEPSGAEWPAKWVEPGDPVRLWWQMTAQHHTKSFRYFITRDYWDPSKPLTRAQLEPEPFEDLPYGGQLSGYRAAHDVVLPVEKTDGRHIILGVWDLANGDAVYACMDVVFAGI